MKKIDVVGRGNVGWHLIHVFSDKADVNSVNSRTLENLRPDCDICILAVPDDKITEVSAEVSCKVNNRTLIAHTSGSVSVNAIAHTNRGV
ncbi:MAG: hypothetical protein K2M87_01000, partial [Muribaculaceae bacterium]|nr:hypothetical protein [Muribaculaceae bacterium]